LARGSILSIILCNNLFGLLSDHFWRQWLIFEQTAGNACLETACLRGSFLKDFQLLLSVTRSLDVCEIDGVPPKRGRGTPIALVCGLILVICVTRGRGTRIAGGATFAILAQAVVFRLLNDSSNTVVAF